MQGEEIAGTEPSSASVAPVLSSWWGASQSATKPVFDASVNFAMQAQPSSSPLPAKVPSAVIDEHGVASGNQQEQVANGIPPPPGEYIIRPPLELGHPMVRAAYPYPDPYYGLIAAYGAQAMMHQHALGVQHSRMPLPSSEMMEEEPVYVNAKQYHGIMRRRQIRAKAELENKLIKTRKPYLHESRHQHALRRARGNGGRFLNTKGKEGKKTSSEGNGSQNSDSSDGKGGAVSVSSANTADTNQINQATNGYHYHSSAFHPLAGGCDGVDNGQGSMVSNMAVATQ